VGQGGRRGREGKQRSAAVWMQRSAVDKQPLLLGQQGCRRCGLPGHLPSQSDRASHATRMCLLQQTMLVKQLAHWELLGLMLWCCQYCAMSLFVYCCTLTGTVTTSLTRTSSRSCALLSWHSLTARCDQERLWQLCLGTPLQTCMLQRREHERLPGEDLILSCGPET
jgi:hypothetical protein